jgi:ferric iron reductase protein FhuF
MMDIDLALEFELLGLSQAKRILAERLNIQMNLHSQDAPSFSDLLDPQHCLVVLTEFSTRIQAVNLTCSGSMFMKYWAVPLLFPYLYALLTEEVSLPWELSALSVQLTATWYWDRHLNLKPTLFTKDTGWTQNQTHETAMLVIFDDLNQVFEVISKVAKVQKYLLWENTALRILQFYDLMQKQNSSLRIFTTILQQRLFLSNLSAEYFGLKQNPFLLLEQKKKLNSGTYQRKKCCFYFQLPESKREYCSSCPLAKKDQERDQSTCQIN